MTMVIFSSTWSSKCFLLVDGYLSGKKILEKTISGERNF